MNLSCRNRTDVPVVRGLKFASEIPHGLRHNSLPLVYASLTLFGQEILGTSSSDGLLVSLVRSFVDATCRVREDRVTRQHGVMPRDLLGVQINSLLRSRASMISSTVLTDGPGDNDGDCFIEQNLSCAFTNQFWILRKSKILICTLITGMGNTVWSGFPRRFFLSHPRNYYKLSLCVTFSNTLDNLWKSWRAVRSDTQVSNFLFSLRVVLTFFTRLIATMLFLYPVGASLADSFHLVSNVDIMM